MKMMIRMQRWGVVALLCLLVVATLLLAQAGVVRAWSADPTVNTAICIASYDQLYPEIASDGSGGAIMAWYDRRSGGSYDIYAQRVDSSGTVQWTANGVAICTASSDQLNPRITSDGSGGAIISWRDYRGGNYDVYAQRVNSSGTVQWTANGVAICTASSDQFPPEITSDGSGGAIITWRDYRSGNDDVYAQRVDSSGTVQWTANGVAICTASSSQYSPEITSDGSGGAIIAWHDYRSGTSYDIYAQRVNSSGTVQWTANGVAICTASSDQLNPRITSDGSGGAIIAWYDYRGSDADIYAQRVNSGGTVQWTADGVATCTASSAQYSPEITSDGSGGAIIAWYDYRSGSSHDIYAQRVNSSGTVQWTGNGVAICTASSEQFYPEITSDGSGGAIIAWYDWRSGNYNVYAQRVDSSGTVQWTGNGVAICTASSSQVYPKITPDGSGGAIIAWHDYRSGSSYDIYAQRVYSSGSLTPPRVTLTSTATSPTKTSPIPMTATFSEAVTGFTAEDIVVGNGTAGNFVAVSGSVYTVDVTPAGQGAVTVDVAADVAHNAAGNGNTAATQFSITYDSVTPTVTLTSTATSPTNTSPIPMTATFSENVTGFTIDDVVVGNGAASNFVAVSGSAYTFDVTPAGQGEVTADIAASVAQDAAGNGNTAATQCSITYDGLAPALTLTSTATSPTKTSPIPMTATFSENVTGFTIDDVVVGNGAANNFVAVSSTVYTFNVSPSGQGAVTVDVAADMAQDAAGNGNAAATQFSITYDTVTPTVTLTSTATSPTKTSPIPVTATFSENVTGFTIDDIAVGNGVAGNFVAVSGSVYTFDVTPAGQGAVTVDVAADVAHDAAGNGNTAASQYSTTYDSAAPTITLTSTATSPTKTSPIPVTATFSENVTGFTIDVIAVGNGVAGNFVAVSGSVYTFDVTPAGQGAVTVDVAADVAHDAAGNGNTAASQYSTTYDSAAPTITLTSTATSPTNTSPIPMTATFSENITGFTIDDVVVSNGTAGNFVAVSGSVYTFDVTPSGQGAVTVDIAASVAQDAAGNGNAAATQFSITYDSVAPTITLTSTATSPTRTSPILVTATFSENVTGFTVDAIVVGNGAASNFVAVSGSVCTFSVTPAEQGVVTVDVVASVAQDAAGNMNTAATRFNVSYDSVVPTVTLSSTNSSPTDVSPIPVTATFSENVTGFTIDDIVVGNGTAGNFVAVSGTVYTFDVTPVGQGVVTVDVAAAVAQDAAGNWNTAAPQYSIVYDTVAPTVTLTCTATSPTKTSPIPMTVAFSEEVTGFTIDDIVVGNGTGGNFAAVSGAVYTFDVTPSGQGPVTVDVTADVAQDAAGNGNTAATQFGIVYDSVAPTVTLTSTALSPTNASPIPMTATFSENVTGFAIGDIAVGNGAASNFVAVSSGVYSFDVTPAGQGIVTVDVAADMAQDAAGNENTAAAQFSTTYVLPPTITSFTVASTGEGNVVTISGANLTGATAVRFGETDALSFTVDSEAQITAVVSPGSSGRITVATPGGTAISDEDYVSPTSPSGSADWWLIVGIVAGLALLGVTAWWLIVSRRRRKQPSA